MPFPGCFAKSLVSTSPSFRKAEGADGAYELGVTGRDVMTLLIGGEILSGELLEEAVKVLVS
jgi:hypothetical protein